MAVRFSFVPALLLTGSLAVAQSADEVVHREPFVVEGRLLTESPATVSTIELTDRPQSELTLPQLSADTANFHLAANDARGFNDTYALRGLTNTPIFGDPAISFYLDDLPLGSGFTFPTEFIGIARAELHRGPTQNTVFGRAGSAGVVTLSTPEASSLATGSVRASIGNYSARAAAAEVATPTSGPIDAYVAVGYAEREGFVQNTQLNARVDDKEALSGLARIRFRATDTAEITLLATALRARDGAQPLVPLGGPLFEVSRSAEGVTEVDAYNAALSAAFTTPIGRLTATTSVTHWELGPYYNTLDFGFAELTNGSNLKQRLWNEEIKLISDESDKVRWQAGAFFSDGHTDGGFVRQFGPAIFEQSTYRIDQQILAGFGEATIDLSAELALTVGLRAERSKKEMDRREIVPTGNRYVRHAESTALLPKIGLSYALAPTVQLFATAGAGHKPGGFSAFTGNAALAAFGPERTKTFEAGITHQPSRELSTTFRAFWYDISGYQIERSFATGSPAGDDYLVINAPKARSLGAELEATWRPVTGLSISGAFGVTQVELRRFTDPYTNISYTGKQAPYVPVLDGSLRVNYQHATGFFVGGSATLTGRTYFSENESLMFGQRAYTLLGAQLGYATARYRVTLFGANLTDERYYSSISPGTFHATPGAPRTYGVEATLKW